MTVYIYIYIIFNSYFNDGLSRPKNARRRRAFRKHCYWQARPSNRSWLELSEIADTFAELEEPQSKMSITPCQVDVLLPIKITHDGCVSIDVREFGRLT